MRGRLPFSGRSFPVRQPATLLVLGGLAASGFGLLAPRPARDDEEGATAPTASSSR